MAENQTIILKYSATAGNVPTLANLVRGELAINSADGKLFIRKAFDFRNIQNMIDMILLGGSNIFIPLSTEVVKV